MENQAKIRSKDFQCRIVFVKYFLCMKIRHCFWNWRVVLWLKTNPALTADNYAKNEGQGPIEQCVDREWLFNFLQLNPECLVDADDNGDDKGDNDCG